MPSTRSCTRSTSWKTQGGSDMARRQVGNRRVRTMWSDLNGLTHGRYIPAAKLDSPTHHAVTTLSMSPEGEILPIAGYSADVGFPDLDAVPMADTRRPGWEPETDVAICQLRYRGEPLAICPR